MTAAAIALPHGSTLRLARPALPSGRYAWFAVAFGGYLALGAYLTLRLHAIHADAYSRVANADFVLFSRDPHLAAIGFVWSPLPSLVELALVPLKVIWPPMVELGFAAVIMSALFMAGSVHQLSGTFRDIGLAWPIRLVLVATFAFHPMVVYYGAIGTSEAPLIFFLLVVSRYLARWVRAPVVGSLVVAGFGLAGAYLTRYEALFSAVGVAFVVGLVTIARTSGRWRARRDAAFSDLMIVMAPFGLVFAGWSLASWIIVGSPLGQFASTYGNASQLAVWAAQGANELGLPVALKASTAVQRLLYLAPGLPVGLLLASQVGSLRRDDRWLAVVGCLGPTLGFMVAAYLVDALAPWLRYFILAVPLSVLLLGLTIAAVSSPRTRVTRGRGIRAALSAVVRRAVHFVASIVRAAVVVAVLGTAALAAPVSALGMLNPAIAPEEGHDLAGLRGSAPGSDDRPGLALRTFGTEREIVAYLDALDLPRGSIVVDSFTGFAIVGQTAHPERLVITSDRDFKPILADPLSFGVRYLLAPPPVDLGRLDAVNVAYPNLAADGAGIARLERAFEARGGSSEWLLYRIIGT